MTILSELFLWLLELLGRFVFEGLLPRLPNRYGGYGCLIVAGALGLLVASIAVVLVMMP